MQSNKSAYLKVIIGPMFSGKTSTLLEIYKKAKFCNKNIVVINYSHDKRYSNTELSSHDLQMIPCKQTIKLCELYNIKSHIDNGEILKQDIILRPIHVFGWGDGKFPIWMNIERQIKANKPVSVEAADCIYIIEMVAIVEKIVDHSYRIRWIIAF